MISSKENDIIRENDNEITFTIQLLFDHYANENFGNRQLDILNIFKSQNVTNFIVGNKKKEIELLLQSGIDSILEDIAFGNDVKNILDNFIYNADINDFLWRDNNIGNELKKKYKLADSSFFTSVYGLTYIYCKRKLEKIKNSKLNGALIPSGYVVPDGTGHAVNMYIRKTTTVDQYEIVIINSGEGIIYHKSRMFVNDQNPIIIHKTRISTIQTELLLFNHVCNNILVTHSKLHIEANIDTFYKGMCLIFNPGDFEPSYMRRVETLKLIKLNDDRGYLYIDTLRDAKVSDIMSDNDDNSYYMPTQIAGSCALYSTYYFVYYLFITDVNGILFKDPKMNFQKQEFYKFSANVRKLYLTKLINKLIACKHDMSLRNYKLYEAVDAHCDNFVNALQNGDEKKIYTTIYYNNNDVKKLLIPLHDMKMNDFNYCQIVPTEKNIYRKITKHETPHIVGSKLAKPKTELQTQMSDIKIFGSIKNGIIFEYDLFTITYKIPTKHLIKNMNNVAEVIKYIFRKNEEGVNVESHEIDIFISYIIKFFKYMVKNIDSLDLSGINATNMYPILSQTFDNEILNELDKMTILSYLIFTIFTKTYCMIQKFKNTYRHTGAKFNLILLVFTLMYRIIFKNGVPSTNLINEDKYKVLLNTTYYLFEQQNFFLSDREIKEISEQIKTISALLPEINKTYNCKERSAKSSYKNMGFINDNVIKYDLHAWRSFYSDKEESYVKNIERIIWWISGFQYYNDNGTNVNYNSAPKLNITKEKTNIGLKLINPTHIKSLFFYIIATLIAENNALGYNYDNYIMLYVILDKQDNNKLITKCDYWNLSLYGVINSQISASDYEEYLSNMSYGKLIAESNKNIPFGSLFNKYIKENIPEYKYITINDDIIEIKNNIPTLIEYESYFLLFELLNNSRIDVINNYSGDWSECILNSLISYSYMNPIKNNDILFEIKNPSDCVVGLERNVCKRHIPSLLNEDIRRSLVNKSLINKLQKKIDMRSDFLLWLSTIIVSLFINNSDADDDVIKQIIVSLTKLMEDNVNDPKFGKYFKILLLITKYDDIEYILNNLNKVYNTSYPYKIDHLCSYLWIIFFQKCEFLYNGEYDISYLDKNNAHDKNIFGDFTIIPFNKNNIINIDANKHKIKHIFMKNNKKYVMYYDAMINEFDMHERANLSGIAYSRVNQIDNNSEKISSTIFIKTKRKTLELIYLGDYKKYTIKWVYKNDTYYYSKGSNILPLIILLNKISDRIIVWCNGIDKYLIDLIDHGMIFEFYDNKLYYEDKEIIINNNYMTLESRWIYGIKNAFIVRDVSTINTNQRSYIFLLKILNDRELENYKSVLKKECWTAIQKQDVYDVNIAFEDKHYFIPLNENKSIISSFQNNSLQAYLSSIALFGNLELIDLVFKQCLSLKCQLPTFVKKSSPQQKKSIINHPFRLKYIYLYDNKDKYTTQEDNRMKEIMKYYPKNMSIKILMIMI